jgi:CheY-like chemotaxis protein
LKRDRILWNMDRKDCESLGFWSGSKKGGYKMANSILNGKRVLAVDDEPDVLDVLEEEILGAAPKCKFEKTTSYQDAAKKLESQDFDVVVLDIMGVRGFDLLDQAVKHHFQVAMLTAHSLNPESLITRRAEFHGLCPWVNVKAEIWYV